MSIIVFGCKRPDTISESYKISGEGWKIWLDSIAPWENDKLYLPDEFKLSEIQTNQPTIGWEQLYTYAGSPCSLPASAEEYYGTSNEWTYHGVIWFYKEVFIPEDYKEKLVFIEVSSFRQRLEIYVNERLAGYDIVSLTPCQTEISQFLIPGKLNRISFRITNPGGQRGWEDHHIINWGEYSIPCTYNYGGIGGEVYLKPVDSVYIDDIFIKNLLPAKSNRIEISIPLNNAAATDSKLCDYTIDIIEKGTKKNLFHKNFKAKITPGSNIFNTILELPEAKQWSIDEPVMYCCEISFDYAGFHGKYQQDFGFRVFETRVTENGRNYFFNGNRIRIKSAIDWGQYAYSGLYPTDDMAYKSISAVKKVGHNTISFHRRIGESKLMDIADTVGVYIYEEPGGLHFSSDSDSSFIVKYMREKIRRMVVRDRNHPGLLIYSLSNEDYGWADWRKDYLLMINQMDNSRFIVNSSGYNPVPNYHIKPYNTVIEKDFIDEHTVGSGSQFEEYHFNTHKPHSDTVFTFFGEVGCYTGPPSVTELYEEAKGQRGFDMNLYAPLYQKIQEVFYSCKMDKYGSGAIKKPADITKQVSRGLMYTNGRLGQIIMSYDLNDGYAINGWSDGPQTVDAWSSALLDMGRNLKGPAEDMRFWNRPLQVAIFRNNGKYFKVGDTAVFRVCIINEGILSEGDYLLHVSSKDGKGSASGYKRVIPVHVSGGEVFAQELTDSLFVKMESDWNAGHITVTANLLSGNDTLAYGCEQVLLQNRSSYKTDLNKYRIAVSNWDAARIALEESGVGLFDFKDQSLDYIIAGEPADTLSTTVLLEKVRNQGIKLIIKFNSRWAEILYDKRVLSEKVIAWGGHQSFDWNGNGWGYIDNYTGNQALPSGSIISTRSWEVPGNPTGFYPFKSYYEQEVYGLYLARSLYPEPIWGGLKGKGDFLKSTYTDNNQLLVLLAALNYGKGKIILAPAYPVDKNNPFNDMLFFNLIK